MTDREEMFAVASVNRRLAADMFAALEDEQWRTPSLCAGWTVREVAAHLVPPEGGFSRWALFRDVVRYRGDLGRMVDVTTRRDAAAWSTAAIVDLLRSRVDDRLDPPVIGPVGPMVDSAIHLRDAARPLGVDVCPEPPTWVPVLDFLVSRPATRGFLPKERLEGLRLVPSDVEWSWGRGAEVRGSAEAVAMAVSGRPAALPDLDGPGADLLARRLDD